jgi:hypothetical protein
MYAEESRVGGDSSSNRHIKKFRINKINPPILIFGAKMRGFGKRSKQRKRGIFVDPVASHLPTTIVLQRDASFRHTNVTINLLRKNGKVQNCMGESKHRTPVSIIN